MTKMIQEVTYIVHRNEMLTILLLHDKKIDEDKLFKIHKKVWKNKK
jgi:hypothetical protein